MRTVKVITCIAIVSAVFVSAGMGATNAVRLTIHSGSRIWIEGTSSFMPYESKATMFSLELGEARASQKPEEASLQTIQESQITNIFLTIPVTNLKSETIGLDPFLYETMKSRENPFISFRLTRYIIEPDAKITNRYSITATGVIKIAGKEKIISIDTIADISNTTRVSGAKELSMSDFGITPPNLFFGLIVCDDRIVVKWDLSLAAEPVMNTSSAASNTLMNSDHLSIRTER
ncbi:MAG: hypothetical protein AABZ39_10345 [Spirochaetota bacterium]